MELRSTTAVAPAPRPAAPSHGITTSFALRFTGYLYAVGLRDALADLIARHEPLRAGRHGAANPVPDLVPRLIATAESSAAITEFLGRDTDGPIGARSFRLLGDPADLDALPEHVLVLNLHRRAAYRVPPPQLARDLMTAYAARRRNRPPNWAVRRLDGHLHVHELRSVQLYQPATAVFDRLAPLGTAV